jgi:hypothetical protein
LRAATSFSSFSTSASSSCKMVFASAPHLWNTN